MAVKVQCSFCEKVLTVPDAARGKAVRCPACETKIPIPLGKDKPLPKKKKDAAQDSSDAIASLDLSKAAAASASICRKCGSDVEEDATECPVCGIDLATGDVGATAKKKARGGPDPDLFFKGLLKDGFKFLGKNQLLAWRSIVYSTVASLLMFGSLFMYLWNSTWPPQYFWALVGIVAALSIPGWYWYLCIETIKLTMEKKDKFKRLNYDFFMSSASGIQSVVWSTLFVLPLQIVPIALAYVMVSIGGYPSFLYAVCASVGYLFLLSMFPIVMSHMSMPITYPGWMIWKIAPIWQKLLKPSVWWTLLTLMLCLPAAGIVGAAAAISGPKVAEIGGVMLNNAAIARAKYAFENRPKPKKGSALAQGADPNEELAKKEPSDFNLTPTLLPMGLWILACAIQAFMMPVILRMLANFTYYHKSSLDLITRAKEYKYVAKEKVDEEEDAVAKPMQEKDGAVIAGVFCLLGVVGGLLLGSFTDIGIGMGILLGLGLGAGIGNLVGTIWSIVDAFRVSILYGFAMFIPLFVFYFWAKHWDRAKVSGTMTLTCAGVSTFVRIVLLAVGSDAEQLPPDIPPGGANPPAAVAPANPGPPAAP
jgi:F0F1-type ATP synthase assembly protein I/ribosomal protein L40E